MKISFIIVNYRSENYLKRCVNSISEKVKNVDHEIIIANNDNKEINPIVLKEKQGKIIEIGENIGFGAACNRAAALAKGDFFCFINPDVEIVSENVSEIIDKFRNNQYIGVIGPKVLESNNAVQPWSVGPKLTLLRLLINNLGMVQSEAFWESKQEKLVDWVTGASMFIEKKLFIDIGGFDERFFMYFEDMDLCLRAQNAGKEVLYFPFCEVLHIGGASSCGLSSQKRQYYSSQRYYFQKHFGKFHESLVRFLGFFHK